MTRSGTRRTQAERTAQTRGAVLDATLDGLVEEGYKATTVTKVAHRAGVSMGAVLHHFPTKADLLGAAVEHAVDRRSVEFRAAIVDLDPSADRLDAAIDLLWSMFQGPTFIAFTELWVAARNDPELAETMVAVDRHFNASSEQLFAELFPAVTEAGEFGVAGLYLTYAVLNGLAMGRLINGYEPMPTDAVLDTFKAMTRLTLSALSSPSPEAIEGVP